MKYKIQKQCRVCSNTNLIRVVELGDHYLSGVFPSGDDMKISKGPLSLVKCYGDESCGLVQLEHTYDHLEMYGDNYGYRSGLNSSMVKHLNDKVNTPMIVKKKIEDRNHPIIATAILLPPFWNNDIRQNVDLRTYS